MAFFEDLTKKLEGAGHTISQKGQEAASIARLKLKEVELNSEIDKLYKEIGCFYVNHTGSPADSEYITYMNSLVQEVRKKQHTVNSIKTDILFLKGMVLCKCGKEVPKSATFCPACGNKMKCDEPKNYIGDDDLPF